ncbi:hypothetical protein HELRODRAFT_165663 [Helobdella robusta]|uniref:F-box domain-containing protein n=1 Tax=Helobdella robusta TaxID=6412 RepID=T1EX53_HELRO|nr:hypothetical protein HELRODRAFT_165663 [Helobdella robusta]ESN91610.1 hypothetical protein HELRODRAFT_165663 [Helobdella robusta]
MLVNHSQKNTICSALVHKWVEDVSLIQEKNLKNKCNDLQLFYNSSSKFSTLPVRNTQNKKQHNCSLKKVEDVFNRFIETKNRCLLSLLKNLKPKTSSAEPSGEGFFPFNDLPSVCKMTVFSFLKETDKGNCLQVCHEWNELIKSQTLWRAIDLTFMKSSHQSSSKLKSFSNFLDRGNHQVTDIELDFQFIVNNPEEMKRFLESEKCNSVKFITITQQRVPVEQTPDAVYKNRRDQRKSANFLETFVAMFRNLEYLSVPFDWAIHSVKSLSKLTNLKSLVLNKSSTFQNLEQYGLNYLLNALVSLEQLDIEVTLPSGYGFQNFTFESTSLKVLNISRSKGLQVVGLKTPNLVKLILSNNPSFIPLLPNDTSLLPAGECLHSIVKHGAPKLLKMNEVELNYNWRCSLKEDVNLLLSSYCNCVKHLKKLT